MKGIERKIKEILISQKEIVFAYLYGSFTKSKDFRDIDIAVYLKNNPNFTFRADLKIKLAKALGICPDIIDLKVLNDILKSPDGFSLLYLKELFREGKLIVNKDFKRLGKFLEEFSNRYREAEALLTELIL